MKTKAFTLITFLTVLLLMLSACQSKSTEPAVVSQPGEPAEITFWHQFDKANAALMEILVSEFNASHADIQVKVVVQPSYDEYKTVLQTSILSGTTPDVATVDLIWVPQLAQDEGLQPLDEFISSDGQFNIDDFYPSLSNYDIMDGKRYGLPFDTNNMQLIWNKDLFAAAGLDPEVPPKTWEEFEAMAIQCSDPEQGIVGMEIYDNPANEGITWTFQVYLWQAGGEFLNADNSAAAFNSPEGLKALTFITNMIQGHGSAPGSVGTFGDSKACMQMDGSWLFGYRKSAPFQWGIAANPAPEGGVHASNTGGEHLVMFKNSVNQAAVWEFIKYLTNAETQLRWDMQTGMLPVLKSVGENQAYLDWINVTEPRMLPFIEEMPYARTRPATPLYNQISDAFAAEIQQAYLAIVTPANALAAAEEAVNKILSEGS